MDEDQKNQLYEKVALVLMPFNKSYDDIYQIGIKEVLRKYGIRCSRIDEELFTGQILEELQKCIAESDIIIAETTDKNANVYYEIGYAHALEKLVLLIAKNADSLPFDIKGYNHIVYNGEIRKLREELEKYLRWIEDTYQSVNIYRNPRLLREPHKKALIYLNDRGEPRPAAEVLERAEGIYGILNDLKLLGYVKFYGKLQPYTPIYITKDGDIAVEALLNMK